MDTLRGSAYLHQVRETKNKKLKLQQLVFQWWSGSGLDVQTTWEGWETHSRQKVQWSSVRCSVYIICWEAKRWAKLILSYFALISNMLVGQCSLNWLQNPKEILARSCKASSLPKKKDMKKNNPKANGSITWCNQLQVVCLTKSGSLACFSWLVDRVVLPVFLRWAWCVVLGS